MKPWLVSLLNPNRLHGLKLIRLKLYQQTILFFILIVLLPLGGVSLIIDNINHKALKKELIRFTEHMASAIYRDMRTEMSWQRREVEMMRHELEQTFQQGQAFASAAQSMFGISPDYVGVGVYTAHGDLIDAHYRNLAQLSPDLRLPFQLDSTDLPQPDAPKVVMRVVFSNTGDPSANVYYLRTIVPAPQALAGKIASSTTPPEPARWLVLEKRFEYLHQLILDHADLLPEAINVFDDTGAVVAGTAATGDGPPKRLLGKDLEYFRKLKPGIAREYAPVQPSTWDLLGIQRLEEEETTQPLEAVIVKIPDIQWGVIIESPYHISQKFIKRARNQTWLLIGGCVGLVILFGVFYGLGISRNFRQLIKGTKAMAEGNYDRKIRLLTNAVTPYEIVYLAGEFNRMARRTAEAWQNSQRLNSELLARNLQETFLNRITKALHGTLSLETIGAVTLAELSQYFATQLCALVILPEPASNLSLPDEQTALTWIYQPQEMADASDDTLLARLPDWLLADELQAPGRFEARQLDGRGLPGVSADSLGPVYVQPVVYQEHRVGWVVLGRDQQAQAFSSEEGYRLGLVSNQIGVAIHQAIQWTTLQDANCKLAKLDELRTHLIDTVSHELRTPLTNIKGYTSRLLRYDDSLTPETRVKSLKVIKQQADRLSRMVDDLLVIPDLEREALRVYPDQVDLLELLERARTFIQEKESRPIIVRYDGWQAPPEEGLDILADPDRLEQVLLNLMDNAIKYASDLEAPIEVVLAQKPSQDFVTISVSNPSEPIAPHVLPTLFEKFKRLDESTTRTTRGSGLGLFITKGLTEAMGGRIELAHRNGRFIATVEIPLFRQEDRLADEAETVV
jgi:signal transduction histidine kinase